MTRSRIKIFNGDLIMPNRIIRNGVVLINDDTIEYVSDQNIEVNNALEIDASGNYIAPGFIDIHVHGGAGYDFMDGAEDSFLKIARLHAKYGTTSMLPTTLSASREELLQTLSAYEKSIKS